jgi:hypothetical protein
LRVFGKLFRGFRAARERHADDLSEDEFFDQQRPASEKVRPPMITRPCSIVSMICPHAFTRRKSKPGARASRLKINELPSHSRLDRVSAETRCVWGDTGMAAINPIVESGVAYYSRIADVE